MSKPPRLNKVRTTREELRIQALEDAADLKALRELSSARSRPLSEFMNTLKLGRKHKRRRKSGI